MACCVLHNISMNHGCVDDINEEILEDFRRLLNYGGIESPGVMRDVLLMERVDGDGVGGRGRGTTGAGGAFGGPRSMAAAILSRLEEMRPRGRSNIATRSRRAFVTLPHPGQLPLQP